MFYNVISKFKIYIYFISTYYKVLLAAVIPAGTAMPAALMAMTAAPTPIPAAPAVMPSGHTDILPPTHMIIHAAPTVTPAGHMVIQALISQRSTQDCHKGWSHNHTS